MPIVAPYSHIDFIKIYVFMVKSKNEIHFMRFSFHMGNITEANLIHPLIHSFLGPALLRLFLFNKLLLRMLGHVTLLSLRFYPFFLTVSLSPPPRSSLSLPSCLRPALTLIPPTPRPYHPPSYRHYKNKYVQMRGEKKNTDYYSAKTASSTLSYTGVSLSLSLSLHLRIKF